MTGQSQGRGLASPESSAPALNIQSPLAACTSSGRRPDWSAPAPDPAPARQHASIFDDCPMCGKLPVEPVHVAGQLACRGCTGVCSICERACIPGDDACDECIRHLEAIPA